jgi:hypothetical protein
MRPVDENPDLLAAICHEYFEVKRHPFSTSTEPLRARLHSAVSMIREDNYEEHGWKILARRTASRTPVCCRQCEYLEVSYEYSLDDSCYRTDLRCGVKYLPMVGPEHCRPNLSDISDMPTAAPGLEVGGW